MGAFLAGVAFELLVLAATGSALSETRVARLRWRAGLLAIISAISTLLLIYGCRGLFLAWQWRNAFDSLPPGSTPIRWYMYPPTWSDIRWMIAELSVNKDAMRRAAEKGYPTATDLADRVARVCIGAATASCGNLSF